MRVYKDGVMYKVSRITGPTHNYLGLKLTMNGENGLPTIEAKSAEGDEQVKHLILESEVLKQVLNGVSEANRQLQTSFVVSAIEYVSTDTPTKSAYELLAKCIVEEAAKEFMESS